jgi:hypothetical protein
LAPPGGPRGLASWAAGDVRGRPDDSRAGARPPFARRSQPANGTRRCAGSKAAAFAARNGTGRCVGCIAHDYLRVRSHESNGGAPGRRTPGMATRFAATSRTAVLQGGGHWAWPRGSQPRVEWRCSRAANNGHGHAVCSHLPGPAFDGCDRRAQSPGSITGLHRRAPSPDSVTGLDRRGRSPGSATGLRRQTRAPASITPRQPTVDRTPAAWPREPGRAREPRGRAARHGPLSYRAAPDHGRPQQTVTPP